MPMYHSIFSITFFISRIVEIVCLVVYFSHNKLPNLSNIILYTCDSFYILLLKLNDVNYSSDKIDKIIKSINEIKITQHKLITSIGSITSFHNVRKLLCIDKKLLTVIDGELNIIITQFNEILAKNGSFNAKIYQ